MKLLLKLFVSLYIILLGAGSHSHAQAVPSLPCSITASDHAARYSNFSHTDQAFHCVLRTFSSREHHHNHKTEERDLEEEYSELISLKKHSEGEHPLVPLYYALLTGFFLPYTRHRVASGKHFSVYKTHFPLYIKFRVFRI
ncbi:hypothetical protein [Sinomicrobium soli]|uniref:hypothetical protein n=1 Tax=Sinomicrobium sp. N-1-3-6 TaxID=2219864 RepID=UPI000DCCC14C|nr:hypothetical protein [Sinomicrobium sp. N-1-3-6]RAV30195.1 hypothetical protein DN748_05225 [Sinomicrobium sp. N-1-3-6]